MNKIERLELRLTKIEKEALQTLAIGAGMSVGRFLVWKALKEDSYYKQRTGL